MTPQERRRRSQITKLVAGYPFLRRRSAAVRRTFAGCTSPTTSAAASPSSRATSRVTVIARDEQSRYAFYRGEQRLGTPKKPQKQRKTKQQSADYTENLRSTNERLQRSNYEQWDQRRRVQQKGVEVQHAQ